MSVDDFDDRMDWSLDMQEKHALKIYNEHWDLSNIIEVDKLNRGGDEQMQVLDFSGTDKILITERGFPIHVAQRFRQPYFDNESGWTDADFSLRVSGYEDSYVEYQKLLDAHNGRGTTPSVYGFGQTIQGREEARQDGFKRFYLIDLPKFLELHSNEKIEPIEKAPNGDGSMGIYFDLADLENSGCIIEQYGADPPWQEGQTGRKNTSADMINSSLSMFDE